MCAEVWQSDMYLLIREVGIYSAFSICGVMTCKTEGMGKGQREGRVGEGGRERERGRLLMSSEPKRNQHNLLNKIRDS